MKDCNARSNEHDVSKNLIGHFVRPMVGIHSSMPSPKPETPHPTSHQTLNPEP